MSHPAKNYSRLLSRRRHAYPFIKLLFQKRELGDAPLLSEIPVEVPEGAEAVRSGLKDVGGEGCVKAQQGKGLVLQSLVCHGELANLEKPAPSRRLRTQHRPGAAQLELGAAQLELGTAQLELGAVRVLQSALGARPSCPEPQTSRTRLSTAPTPHPLDSHH